MQVNNMSELIPIQQLRERLAQTTFAVWLGLILDSSGDSGVVFRMPTRPEMLGSPSTGALHGGVVASVIDTAASYAVMARTGRSLATVDMRVDYHRAAISPEYRIEGSIVRLGRKIATSDARMYDDRGALLASGRALLMHVDR
jgi:uncharacterized protein (TIGR00369 family)